MHESEKLAGVLEKMGYVASSDLESADVIVFNTCAIRAGAEDRAFGNIGALKRLKKENPNKIIAVCGCMVMQNHIVDKIIDSASIDNDTLVIEIGPGEGALSSRIVSRAKYAIFYEIDVRLKNNLDSILSDYDNYSIIINDFLTIFARLEQKYQSETIKEL